MLLLFLKESNLLFLLLSNISHPISDIRQPFADVGRKNIFLIMNDTRIPFLPASAILSIRMKVHMFIYSKYPDKQLRVCHVIIQDETEQK